MSRSSWGFPKRQIEIDQETNSHSYLLLGTVVTVLSAAVIANFENFFRAI